MKWGAVSLFLAASAFAHDETKYAGRTCESVVEELNQTAQRIAVAHYEATQPTTSSIGIGGALGVLHPVASVVYGAAAAGQASERSKAQTDPLLDTYNELRHAMIDLKCLSKDYDALVSIDDYYWEHVRAEKKRRSQAAAKQKAFNERRR